MPRIRVAANGRDQKVYEQSYATISVAILDEHTIHLIQKKNGQLPHRLSRMLHPEPGSRSKSKAPPIANR
jgi:hypothetical protein